MCGRDWALRHDRHGCTSDLKFPLRSGFPICKMGPENVTGLWRCIKRKYVEMVNPRLTAVGKRADLVLDISARPHPHPRGSGWIIANKCMLIQWRNVRSLVPSFQFSYFLTLLLPNPGGQKWRGLPASIIWQVLTRLPSLGLSICSRPTFRDVGGTFRLWFKKKYVQRVGHNWGTEPNSSSRKQQGQDPQGIRCPSPPPVYLRPNLIHPWECLGVVVQVSVSWGLPDVSSEKGLLYYLHEPIYVSKSSGFSTIPQGCMPHLSPYRAALSARRSRKGEAAGAEGKTRLFTPCAGRPQMGPHRGQPCSSWCQWDLQPSQSPFRRGFVRQLSFLPCYIGRIDCLFFLAAMTITTTNTTITIIHNTSPIIFTIAPPLPSSSSIVPSPHHQHRTTDSSITVFLSPPQHKTLY